MIGMILKNMRLTAKLPQVELGKKLSMADTTVSSYERENSQADFDYILNICKQNDVELIISGLPLSMNGQENVQTQKTREFIEVLQSQTNIPIKFVDERLTTVSAQRVLIESGMRRENRKNVVDKVAAAIILQGYLDRF